MRSVPVAALIIANIVVLAQTQNPPAGGIIQGVVKSGNTPIPGVAITATNFITDEKIDTSTDLNGQYQLKVPSTGAYIVETSMAAFATGIKEAEPHVWPTPGWTAWTRRPWRFRGLWRTWWRRAGRRS